MAIKAAVFTGTGLNDLTAGGTYSGSTAAVFTIEILSNGVPDVFRWKKDSGSWASRAITGAEQILQDGVTVKFNATIGHTVGSYWTISTVAGGQPGWDQGGKDYRKSNLAPKAMGLDGTARWTTAYDDYSGIYSDLILHQSEVGSYSVIEGEAIVTKTLYKDYLYFVTQTDSSEFSLVCIDPGNGGTVVWAYPIDLTAYLGTSTTIAFLSGSMFFLWADEDELRLMCQATTEHAGVMDVITNIVYDQGYQMSHDHEAVATTVNEGMSIVGIRYDLDGNVLGGSRLLVEGATDGISQSNCAVMLYPDGHGEEGHLCGVAIAEDGLYQINGYVVASNGFNGSYVAKGKTGYLDWWGKWRYSIGGGSYVTFGVLYRCKMDDAGALTLSRLLTGHDYQIGHWECMACSDSGIVRSKGAIDTVVSGFVSEDSSWAQQWAVAGLDCTKFTACSIKNSFTDAESVLIATHDQYIKSYDAATGAVRGSAALAYEVAAIAYEKPDPAIPDLSYIIAIGVGQGKLISNGNVVFGPAVTWEQSDALITHWDTRYLLPIFDGENIYIPTATGLVGYSAAGSFLFAYEPGKSPAANGEKGARPCCSDQMLYLPMLDGTGDLEIHALISGVVGMFTVSNTAPTDEATGIDPGTEISIEFSSQIKAATITGTSVVLSDGEGSVAYTVVSTTDKTLVIRPDAALTPETEYTVTLTTDLTNLDNVALPEEYTFTFTVSARTEYISVTSTTPADGAIVPPETNEVRIVFSADVDGDTVDGTSLSISPAAGYTVGISGDTITMSFTEALVEGDEYTVTLTEAIQSTTGAPLPGEYTFAFTPVADLDLISSTPTNGAASVNPNTVGIVIEFSADLDPATITETSVIVSPTLAYTSSISGTTLTLETEGLDSLTSYTITLSTDIRSVAGGALSEEHVIAFATTSRPLTEANVYIEAPDAAYASRIEVIMKSPSPSYEMAGGHEPKWRLHFKLESYRDVNTGTEEEPVWERALTASVNSESNPELFRYSGDTGVTWEIFPVDGLPSQQYGALVKVPISVGVGVGAYLVPYCGAEPA